MNGKLKSLMMTTLMIASAMAGCLSDVSTSSVDLDDADGGYEYVSNVDNHRMLMTTTSIKQRVTLSSV